MREADRRKVGLSLRSKVKEVDNGLHPGVGRGVSPAAVLVDMYYFTKSRSEFVSKRIVCRFGVVPLYSQKE